MLPGPVVCEPVRHQVGGKQNMMLTLVKPSIKMTATSKIEENTPSIDATESNESGINTAGKNLVESRQRHALPHAGGKSDEHNQAEDLIKIGRICRTGCFY